MNRTEIIARRILGWKLNSTEKWFDYEKGVFIENFHPEENMEQAMLIVDKMKELGFTYTVPEDNKICFDQTCAKGNTLSEAIVKAAYAIADNSSVDDEWL